MKRFATAAVIWLLATTVALSFQAQNSLRSLVNVSIHAVVTHIADGDTLDIKRPDGATIRVRLDGVDTPETGRPFSRVATAFTRSMAFDREVVVRGTDVDRYGRLVARVVVDGKDLSVALVSAGLAWHYVCYSTDKALADAERVAKAAKRGMSINQARRPPWNCIAKPRATAEK